MNNFNLSGYVGFAKRIPTKTERSMAVYSISIGPDEWVRLYSFGAHADYVIRNLRKGTLVEVSGKVRVNNGEIELISTTAQVIRQSAVKPEEQPRSAA